ncbi:MAG: T9SS type A sorting domain-containing protein [Flavobacteriales bacterium]
MNCDSQIMQAISKNMKLIEAFGRRALLTAFATLSIVLTGHSQEIINSTSGQAEIDGNIFEYAIGEMVLVDAFSSSEVLLTQGYLQPSEVVTISVSEFDESNQYIHVYPNPFSSMLQIGCNGIPDGNYNIDIMDASGRLVYQHGRCLLSSNQNIQLDLSAFAVGYYVIKVSSVTSGVSQICKIVKN